MSLIFQTVPELTDNLRTMIQLIGIISFLLRGGTVVRTLVSYLVGPGFDFRPTDRLSWGGFS